MFKWRFTSVLQKESTKIQQFFWLQLQDSKLQPKCHLCDITSTSLPIFICYLISFAFLLLFLHFLLFSVFTLTTFLFSLWKRMCTCIKMKLQHARECCWNEILLHRNAQLTPRNVVVCIYIKKKEYSRYKHCNFNKILKMSCCKLQHVTSSVSPL